MDSKKQDLTPELKQIYERVMNTQVKTGTPQTPPVTPTQSSSPQAAPQSTQATPLVSGVLPQTQAQTTPEVSTPATGQVEPKPLKEGGDKPFVFSSGKKVENTKTASIGVKGGGMKISPALMVVGLVALIVIYSVVWLKVFNFF